MVKSGGLFDVLKVAGAAWLLWLGIQLIHSGIHATDMTLSGNRAIVTLKDAWLANVLNPKAIMFYLTVVSQFVGSNAEVSHYLVLASVHTVIMCVWLIAISKALIFSAKKADPLVLKKYVNSGGGILLVIFSLNSLVH